MGQAARQFDYGNGDAGAPPVVEMRNRVEGRLQGRVQDRGTSALAVSIFADRSYLRAEMEEDAVAAGLRIAHTADLGNLLGSENGPALGDLVLVDCPVIDGAELAALARLDLRAAKSGSQLVVSTSIGSLDDVFGCLDQSDAQILVTPSRADRVIALGRTLARAGNRVRELSEEDRLALLRLTEQVGQIAQKLEALSSGSGAAAAQASAFRFDDSADEARLDDGTDRLVRAARPPLPDPRLVRKIIRQRQLRARFFEGDLFADPAWDMLLDLTAARAEHVRVSVTSLCIASGVPPTTALRWIGQMTDAGLLQRVDDETDRRRAFITLTDKAADAMARYFAELGAASATLV
ncbi:winged helix DNA-binding protein [Novosphingobium sp.]|uniref:winged helix DNA-binding protein n=1 Tax=Novosphingobium sp. TaxID=1874826 RepID=UPI003BA88B22